MLAGSAIMFVCLGCRASLVLSLVLTSLQFASWFVVLLTIPRHSLMMRKCAISSTSGESSLVLHLYGIGACVVLMIIGVVELLDCVSFQKDRINHIQRGRTCQTNKQYPKNNCVVFVGCLIHLTILCPRLSYPLSIFLVCGC
jgi:hypothetical protein